MAQAKAQSKTKSAPAQKVWQEVSVSVPIAEGVTVSYENSMFKVTGPKGEVSRKLRFPRIEISIQGSDVVISTKRFSKKLKKVMHTYRAHVTNLMTGVSEGFEYKLKVVYAKFPMTVELKGNELNVKNLLGEKVPRQVIIPETVKVEVKGEDITVTGIDKEECGKVAALIEQSTRITHLDRRVVQDGIYITSKPHKEYV